MPKDQNNESTNFKIQPGCNGSGKKGHNYYLVLAEQSPVHWFQNIENGHWLVGRSSKCPICIRDVTVSRHHAELQRQGLELKVQDLGSHNGTFVNGIKVDRAILKIGDHVQFGKVRFALRDQEPEPRSDLDQPSTITDSERRMRTNGISENGKDFNLENNILVLFSPSEQKVIRLMILGFGEKEIAQKLHVSIHTVHSHIKKVYRKVGVHSRSELLVALLHAPQVENKITP